jgi:hypothetical protein
LPLIYHCYIDENIEGEITGYVVYYWNIHTFAGE